jgi:hypothetical protein
MILPNSPPNRDLITLLSAAGLGLHLTEIVLVMSELSRSLEYAIDEALTIPSRAFDEDTMGIQYDLLLAPTDSANAIDTACRSACLIYMKSLTREDPCDFQPIIEALVTSIEKVEVSSSNTRLLFWINFMGATAGQCPESRSWFRENLVTLRYYLGLVEWAEAEHILKSISYVHKIHSPSGILVWSAL